MKAKLEFSLPEDKSEFKMAIKACDFFDAIYDFNEFIRRYEKHRDISEQEHKILMNIRKKWLILTEDLNLYEFE